MKVKKVKAIRCPECDAIILKKDIPDKKDLFQCRECDEVYDDLDDAKECCKGE